jgi:hypothetical protein
MAMVMAAEGSHMSNNSNMLDPEGDLQHHISLESVYAKLPMREFYLYRSVCKEWNRLAGDREFLEERDKHLLIPKRRIYHGTVHGLGDRMSFLLLAGS